jgi:hypothetical protein
MLEHNMDLQEKHQTVTRQLNMVIAWILVRSSFEVISIWKLQSNPSTNANSSTADLIHMTTDKWQESSHQKQKLVKLCVELNSTSDMVE